MPKGEFVSRKIYENFDVSKLFPLGLLILIMVLHPRVPTLQEISDSLKRGETIEGKPIPPISISPKTIASFLRFLRELNEQKEGKSTKSTNNLIQQNERFSAALILLSIEKRKKIKNRKNPFLIKIINLFKCGKNVNEVANEVGILPQEVTMLLELMWQDFLSIFAQELFGGTEPAILQRIREKIESKIGTSRHLSNYEILTQLIIYSLDKLVIKKRKKSRLGRKDEDHKRLNNLLNSLEQITVDNVPKFLGLDSGYFPFPKFSEMPNEWKHQFFLSMLDYWLEIYEDHCCFTPLDKEFLSALISHEEKENGKRFRDLRKISTEGIRISSNSNYVAKGRPLELLKNLLIYGQPTQPPIKNIIKSQ